MLDPVTYKQLMTNIVASKFSPKIHNILDILLHDPLLSDILFDVITFNQGDDGQPYSKSLFPLEYHIKRLSDYIFMNNPMDFHIEKT
jgi:hypothetical protein